MATLLLSTCPEMRNAAARARTGENIHNEAWKNVRTALMGGGRRDLNVSGARENCDPAEITRSEPSPPPLVACGAWSRSRERRTRREIRLEPPPPSPLRPLSREIRDSSSARVAGKLKERDVLTRGIFNVPTPRGEEGVWTMGICLDVYLYLSSVSFLFCSRFGKCVEFWFFVTCTHELIFSKNEIYIFIIYL